MEHAVRAAVADRLRDRGAQHRVRTDLQEYRVIRDRRADGGAEEDPLADVAGPVTGVEVEPGARRAGDRRDHPYACSSRRQSTERGFELSRVRLHLIAVKGVIDRDRLNARLLLPQDVGQLIDRRRLARHDRGASRVDGRNRDAAFERRRRALRFARREIHRHHLSKAGGLLHDPPAIHGNACSVRER